jgi:hypothetical protein
MAPFASVAYVRAGWGVEVREGRAAEFCFDAEEGTATRNNEGVAVAMNREFFALLTALREMRVTPRVVSIAGNDDEDEDDDEEDS